MAVPVAPVVLRVVGPPGSGKSLLITSLMDVLRARGHRTASAVRRDAAVTVIALSTGGRSTLDRDVPAGYLATVVSWIDPGVRLVFAEGYEDTEPPSLPAVELRAPGGVAVEAAPFALVAPGEVAAGFAERGPDGARAVQELADRIEGELLGVVAASEPEPAGDEPPPGLVARWLRRFR